MGIPIRLAVSDRHHGYSTEIAAERADGQVILFPGSNLFRDLAEKQEFAAEVVRRWNAYPLLLEALKELKDTGVGPEWPAVAGRLWDMAVSKAEAAIAAAGN